MKDHIVGRQTTPGPPRHISLPEGGDCEKSLIVSQSDSSSRLEPLNQGEMSSKYLGPWVGASTQQPILIIFSQDGLW